MSPTNSLRRKFDNHPNGDIFFSQPSNNHTKVLSAKARSSFADSVKIADKCLPLLRQGRQK